MRRGIGFIMAVAQGVQAYKQRKREIAVTDRRLELLALQKQLTEQKIADTSNQVVLGDLQIDLKVLELKERIIQLEDLLRRRGVTDFQPLNYPDHAGSDPGVSGSQGSDRIERALPSRARK